jgi:hypothetical protein
VPGSQAASFPTRHTEQSHGGENDEIVVEDREKLEALRALLASAKAGWITNEGNQYFPPHFAVVERMIDDQQRYLDDPVALAVHCMGMFADYLPFEMLAVLVLSEKHLADETIAILESDLEFDVEEREYKSLRFFKLGEENAGFLIEVPLEEEDWEQGMPEDLFRLLRYAEDRSCRWVLLAACRT